MPGPHSGASRTIFFAECPVENQPDFPTNCPDVATISPGGTSSAPAAASSEAQKANEAFPDLLSFESHMSPATVPGQCQAVRASRAAIVPSSGAASSSATVTA
ncbi:unnamed protein product, partial [Polarella glacialis]